MRGWWRAAPLNSRVWSSRKQWGSFRHWMGCSSLQPAWHTVGSFCNQLCQLLWFGMESEERFWQYNSFTLQLPFNIQNTNAQLLEVRVALSKNKKGLRNFLCVILSHCMLMGSSSQKWMWPLGNWSKNTSWSIFSPTRGVRTCEPQPHLNASTEVTLQDGFLLSSGRHDVLSVAKGWLH